MGKNKKKKTGNRKKAVVRVARGSVDFKGQSKIPGGGDSLGTISIRLSEMLQKEKGKDLFENDSCGIVGGGRGERDDRQGGRVQLSCTRAGRGFPRGRDKNKAKKYTRSTERCGTPKKEGKRWKRG